MLYILLKTQLLTLMVCCSHIQPHFNPSILAIGNPLQILSAFGLMKIINIFSDVAVGDEESDPALMEFLGAEMKKESGQFFKVDPT